MTLDTIAALAVRTLQSTQWTGAGLSSITKQLGIAMWPQLKGFLWQRYSPVVMTKYVNPLARRTVLPVAQKMGKTVVRRYGVPLARKTGNKIWIKAGEPMARKYFPNFFEENPGLIPDNQGVIPENQGMIPDNSNIINAKAVPANPLQNLLSKTPRGKRKLRKNSAAKLGDQALTLPSNQTVNATPHQAVAMPPIQATTMPPIQATTMPPIQATAMPPSAIMVNETVSPEQPRTQIEMPSGRGNRSSLGLFGNTGLFGTRTTSGNVASPTENTLTPTPAPTPTPTPTPTDSRHNLLGRHLGMGMLSNRLNK